MTEGLLDTGRRPKRSSTQLIKYHLSESWSRLKLRGAHLLTGEKSSATLLFKLPGPDKTSTSSKLPRKQFLCLLWQQMTSSGRCTTSESGGVGRVLFISSYTCGCWGRSRGDVTSSLGLSSLPDPQGGGGGVVMINKGSPDQPLEAPQPGMIIIPIL